MGPLVLGALAVGCVHERVSVARLVQAARADYMRAHRDYAHQRFEVFGVVMSKTLLTSDSVTIQGSVNAVGAISARRVTRQVDRPLLVLEPGAYCFFSAEGLDEVIETQVGEAVELVCTVREFRAMRIGRVPILTNCEFR